MVAFNQDSPWQAYMDAGKQAYERGNYPEAERQWGAALKEAEGFGPDDLRQLQHDFGRSLSG